MYNTAKELGDEFSLVKGANSYTFIGFAKKDEKPMLIQEWNLILQFSS